ncbi:Hypothetical predicted protein, partial [Olea europaea subsp. europaea]
IESTPEIPPLVHENTPGIPIQTQTVAPLVVEDMTEIAPIDQPLAEPIPEALIETDSQ